MKNIALAFVLVGSVACMASSAQNAKTALEYRAEQKACIRDNSTAKAAIQCICAVALKYNHECPIKEESP